MGRSIGGGQALGAGAAAICDAVGELDHGGSGEPL